MTALTEELFELLRARILAGELPPGSRLPPERELAATYGTNRNTLREAIRRLEQSRLVTVRQGQGVTVEDFRAVGTIELLGPFLTHANDPAEKARVVLDLLEPRARVIDFLVELAARVSTGTDRSALRAAASAVREAEAKRDVAAHIVAEFGYLDSLVNATHSVPTRWIANPLLYATRGMLERQPQWVLFTPSFATMAEEVNEHLERGDAHGARAACASFHSEIDSVIRPLLEHAAGRAGPGPGN
ncbi:MAG: FadR family transcriptional regulator [Polyangiaceae bacterium]|nr:FadR family transcriptional regulator [Polyangiaceae bacterium]